MLKKMTYFHFILIEFYIQLYIRLLLMFVNKTILEIGNTNYLLNLILLKALS